MIFWNRVGAIAGAITVSDLVLICVSEDMMTRLFVLLDSVG